MSGANYWPSMTDYQEALQKPSVAFSAPDLSRASVVENKLGLPRPICGTFASVYELFNGRRRWAVKCFLRNTPDLHERYALISDHLKKCRRLGYFVAFDYLEESIKVRGQLFPFVKMEWIEAAQLNTFVEQNLNKTWMLKKLDANWDRLVQDLRGAEIAHGDLQHGNVLVKPNGAIQLIDYDGMCVPALEGHSANETGHADYQNPRRTQNDFDLKIDTFSACVIKVAIRALMEDPNLWAKYNNGDNLLFRRNDFMNTEKSPLIQDLRAMGNAEIDGKLDYIVNACPKRKKSASASTAAAPAPEAEETPQVSKGTRPANKKRIPPSKRKRPTKRRKKGTRPAAPAASNGGGGGPAWLSDHVEDFGKPEAAAAATAAEQDSGGLFGFLGKLFGGGETNAGSPS